MWDKMVLRKNQVGFGVTKVEAEQDWYTNRCKESIENDTEHKYTTVFERLKPWRPASYMFHVANLGCLQYVNGTLKNLRSNTSIPVSAKGLSIYYYIGKMFGDMLEYDEICVVLQKTLNEFFKQISSDFVKLQDYPLIRVAESSEFKPEAVYTMSSGVTIAYSDNVVGLKKRNSNYFYIVEMQDRRDLCGLIYYLGYRAGISFGTQELGI